LVVGRSTVRPQAAQGAAVNKSDDQLIDNTRERIKLPHWGGHEHFELVAEPEGTEPRVYRWSMRTRIAE
jgi:hypothetical protein